RFIETRAGSALGVLAGSAGLNKSGHQAFSLFAASRFDPQVARRTAGPISSVVRERNLHRSDTESGSRSRETSDNGRREVQARYMKVCCPPPKSQRTFETAPPRPGPTNRQVSFN